MKCEAVAPTLVPVKAGDRIKTDRRDAAKLARNYRAAELTPGYRMRHTRRCAIWCVRGSRPSDQLRGRHRLSTFLLRHGRRAPKGHEPLEREVEHAAERIIGLIWNDRSSTG